MWVEKCDNERLGKMRVRRRDTRIWFMALGVFAAVFFFTFLTAKGNCRDTNISRANAYPSVSYHIKDGHFVCLAEETFGDGMKYGEDAPNGDSAAHIIWQAAQDYKINPKAVIVLVPTAQGFRTEAGPLHGP